MTNIMPDPWHSLYIPEAEPRAVADTIAASLNARGYTPYDPFGLIPARAYPRAVRAFVAPASPVWNGWVRVVGTFPADTLSGLLGGRTFLRLALDGDQETVEAWNSGQMDARATWQSLHLYTQQGTTLADIEHALTTTHIPTAEPITPTLGGVPADALPANIRALAEARGVNAAQAGKLFEKMLGTVSSKLGGGDRAGAVALLQSPGAQWNSVGGARLRALAALLGWPDSWNMPDYENIRVAYTLFRRQQALPNARLYPGDAEAVALVPNAGDYLPLYFGSA